MAISNGFWPLSFSVESLVLREIAICMTGSNVVRSVSVFIASPLPVPLPLRWTRRRLSCQGNGNQLVLLLLAFPPAQPLQPLIHSCCSAFWTGTAGTAFPLKPVLMLRVSTAGEFLSSPHREALNQRNKKIEREGS
jgi:hypothetical protein